MALETRDDIIAAIRRADRMPTDQPRFDLLSQAAVAADALNEEKLAVWARLSLVSSYLYTAHRVKAFPIFSWCLDRFRTRPELFDDHDRRTLIWDFKHIVVSAAGSPDIPLTQLQQLEGEFEALYREQGASMHTVHGVRAAVAAILHNAQAEEEHMLGWRTTARDEYSDCVGCDPELEVKWLISRGEYEAAIAAGQPVLSGRVGCQEQPSSTYCALTVAYEKLGLREEAWQAHIRAYAVQSKDMDHLESLTVHVRYLVLSGNLSRALAIIRRHASLVEKETGADVVMYFLAECAATLGALEEAGRGEQEFAVPMSSRPGLEPAFKISPRLTIAEAGRKCADVALALAQRFDERNGTTRVSDHIRRAISARPLDVDAAPPSENAAPPSENEEKRAGSVAAPAGVNDHSPADISTVEGAAMESAAPASVPVVHPALPTGPTAWEGISWPTCPDEVVLLGREAAQRGDGLLDSLANDAALLLADEEVSDEYRFEWAARLAVVYSSIVEPELAKEWLLIADDATPPPGPLALPATLLLANATSVAGKDDVAHGRLLKQELPGIIAELGGIYDNLVNGKESPEIARRMADHLLHLAYKLMSPKYGEFREPVADLLQSLVALMGERGWDSTEMYAYQVDLYLIKENTAEGDIYWSARELDKIIRDTERAPLEILSSAHDMLAGISREYEQWGAAVEQYRKSLDISSSFGVLYDMLPARHALASVLYSAGKYEEMVQLLQDTISLASRVPALGNVTLLFREQLAVALRQIALQKDDFYSSPREGYLSPENAELLIDVSAHLERAFALRGRVMDRATALRDVAKGASWLGDHLKAAHLSLQAADICGDDDSDRRYASLTYLLRATKEYAELESERGKGSYSREIEALEERVQQIFEVTRSDKNVDADYLEGAVAAVRSSISLKRGDITDATAHIVRAINSHRKGPANVEEAESLLTLGFLRCEYPGSAAEVEWGPERAERLCYLVNRLYGSGAVPDGYRRLRTKYIELAQKLEALGEPTFPTPISVPEGDHPLSSVGK
ncbi:MAG: hypothetical protein Q4C87_00380 [Actinomycetaceae bacterium]|nr:hypothetical protein [Actinomycetaceae bacterium]